jgi:hypothetical protein
MESTPIVSPAETGSDQREENTNEIAEKNPEILEKGTFTEDKTEVTVDADADDDQFFDAEDEEEQKVQEDQSVPKMDEITQESETNLKKLDSKSIDDGPEEKVPISQINDYTDFKIIDKLDKDTYITELHKNYVPSEQDIFIQVKKSGMYQRLIWGEPLKLKDKES